MKAGGPGEILTTEKEKIMTDGSGQTIDDYDYEGDISSGVNAAEKATHEIGAVALAGEHKGAIYGGVFPDDNQPIWFSVAPKLMAHFAAVAWAKEQGGSLPTRKQGDYLTTLKGEGGAFTELFNRDSSFPAGCVWLGEPYTGNRYLAWYQRLGNGDQGYHYLDVWNDEMPVLCVRR
jgi:hypothetical protein